MPIDPTASLSFREARMSDGAEIAALLGELGYPTTSEQVRERLKRLKLEADRVLLAVISADVAGLASLHIMPLLHEDGPQCRLTAFVVKAAYRNLKIGTKFLDAVEDWAVRLGCVRLELTSNHRRTSAHRFYLRNGYQEHSRHFTKLLKPKR